MGVIGDVKDPDNPDIQVFIRTYAPITPVQSDFLKTLPIEANVVGRKMVTAALSLNQIDIVSHQSWVKYLKLSSKLKPL